MVRRGCCLGIDALFRVSGDLSFQTNEEKFYNFILAKKEKQRYHNKEDIIMNNKKPPGINKKPRVIRNDGCQINDSVNYSDTPKEVEKDITIKFTKERINSSLEKKINSDDSK